MNFKPYVVVISVVTALIMGQANLAQARGFGSRGGVSVRIGIGGSRPRAVRYYGPGFYAAPGRYGSYRQGSRQFQQRPWYYSRSGPFEYYRSYSPLYRMR